MPSPDPDTPWDLDEATDSPSKYAPGNEQLALYRTDPLRAVAGSAGQGDAVTAAEIQLAVSRARYAGATP